MIKYPIDFSENEFEYVFDEKHLPKSNVSMQSLNVRCPLESILSLSRSREDPKWILHHGFIFWILTMIMVFYVSTVTFSVFPTVSFWFPCSYVFHITQVKYGFCLINYSFDDWRVIPGCKYKLPSSNQSIPPYLYS